MYKTCITCGSRVKHGDGHTKIFHNCHNIHDHRFALCKKCTNGIVSKLGLPNRASMKLVGEVLMDYPHTKAHVKGYSWVQAVVALWAWSLAGCGLGSTLRDDVERNPDISGVSITRDLGD